MTGAYLHKAGNAMTRTEREVMSRWDAGASMEQIRRAMPGVKLAKVRAIVSLFHDSGDHTRATATIATASAALRDAILSDPHYPGNQA